MQCVYLTGYNNAMCVLDMVHGIYEDELEFELQISTSIRGNNVQTSYSELHTNWKIIVEFAVRNSRIT
jgi:hypothetical protein